MPQAGIVLFGFPTLLKLFVYSPVFIHVETKSNINRIKSEKEKAFLSGAVVPFMTEFKSEHKLSW